MAAPNALRRQVLTAYKELHRARLVAFKDDERALTAARQKIREEFYKHHDVSNPEEIQRLAKFAKEVAEVLRKDVLQVETVAPDRAALRIRPDNLIDVQACYKD